MMPEEEGAQDSQKEPQTSEEELAVYEKLRRSISKSLGEFHDKVNAETISRSMDNAAVELKEAGEYSKKAIARAIEAMKKDLASTGHFMSEVSDEAKKRFDDLSDKGGELWGDIGKEADYLKDISLDKGAAFLLNIVNAVGDWSQKFSEKLSQSLKYKTGEITHGGAFDCINCEATIHMKKAGRIPPCPKCSKTEFRRA
jgi:isocitrate dehydrogenase